MDDFAAATERAKTAVLENEGTFGREEVLALTMSFNEYVVCRPASAPGAASLDPVALLGTSTSMRTGMALAKGRGTVRNVVHIGGISAR